MRKREQLTLLIAIETSDERLLSISSLYYLLEFRINSQMAISEITQKREYSQGTKEPQEPPFFIYTWTLQSAAHSESTGVDTSLLTAAPIPELAPFPFSHLLCL